MYGANISRGFVWQFPPFAVSLGTKSVKDMETTHSTDTTPPSFPCCMCNGEVAPRQQGMTLPGILRTCLAMLVLATFLAGCGRHGDFRQRLDDADSLMDCQPDSAYRILCSLDSIANGMPRSLRMYHWLLRSKAQNKAFVPFADDSLMSSVAEYYDSHGNANEQMLSHYIMGCIYRDMNLAPKAIEEYHEAVERADTTDSEFDYDMLACIYSQMASIYGRILIPTYEAEYRRKALCYSLKDGNESMAALECCLLSRVYMLQNKTDSAEISILKARKLFDKHGETRLWLQLSGSLTYIYLRKTPPLLDETKAIIDQYERESGLFDPDGQLPDRHKSFFCTKAEYYKCLGKLDSAEYFFRKAMHDNMSHTSCNRIYHGFLDVFKERGNVDSIAKYSELYCAANDSSISIKDQDIAARMSASYDYMLYANRANRLELAHTRLMSAIVIIVLAIATVVLGMIAMFFRYRKKTIARQAFMERQENNYKCLMAEYDAKIQALEDLMVSHENTIESLNSIINSDKQNYDDSVSNLKKHYNEKFIAYQGEILKLKEQIKKVAKFGTLSMENIAIGNMNEERIIIEIRNKIYQNDPIINEDEWRELTRVVGKYYPMFLSDLDNNDKITKSMARVCILTFIGFRVKEISALMGMKLQSVSNMKQEICSVLFGDNTARTLGKHLANRYIV